MDPIRFRKWIKEHAAAVQAVSPPAAKPVYLHVPFDDKDQAKALGAKFDSEKKQWFVFSDVLDANKDAFAAWTNAPSGATAPAAVRSRMMRRP
jgi:putative DNA primase/helicase